jgi:ApaG protein
LPSGSLDAFCLYLAFVLPPPDNGPMSTAISHSIRISVRVRFEDAHSDPGASHFLFSYRITIANVGEEPVRLLRRHWIIRDSLAAVREVEGPGVVGETPVIPPGEQYAYSSACDLRSRFGRMDGTYLMERLSDGQFFRVQVPTMHFQEPRSAN